MSNAQDVNLRNRFFIICYFKEAEEFVSESVILRCSLTSCFEECYKIRHRPVFLQKKGSIAVAFL